MTKIGGVAVVNYQELVFKDVASSGFSEIVSVATSALRYLTEAYQRLKHVIWARTHRWHLQLVSDINQKSVDWLKKYESHFSTACFFPGSTQQKRFFDSPYHKKLTDNILVVRNFTTAIFNGLKNISFNTAEKRLVWTQLVDGPAEEIPEFISDNYKLTIPPKIDVKGGTCYGQTQFLMKYLLENKDSKISGFSTYLGKLSNNEVIYYQILQNQINFLKLMYFNVMKRSIEIVQDEFEEYFSGSFCSKMFRRAPSSPIDNEALQQYMVDASTILQDSLFGFKNTQTEELPYKYGQTYSRENLEDFLRQSTARNTGAECYHLGFKKAKDEGGHAVLVHINGKNGVYEFYDPIGIGCLTFDNRESLIKAVLEHLEVFQYHVNDVTKRYNKSENIE